MIKVRRVEPISTELLEEIGMTWHTDQDGSPYVSDELVQVSQDEAEAYYRAANELYDMYIEAAQQVIDKQRYYELGIPSNLVPLIELSWERDDWHLYGRFDLAGGLDGLPIKLIEFNADTPTCLFETAIVQWALLKANGMDQNSQFNNIHEMLQDNFKRLITRAEEVSDFDRQYSGEKILFSSVRELPEDERTVRFLQQIAGSAGFYNDFSYLDETGFIEGQGVFNTEEQQADFWFKLYPWEDIAAEELELTNILSGIARQGTTRFINPAYTLLFQSKGILKVLYEMFPTSPYLLRCDFAPLAGAKQVAKKLFGREGANTAILDADGHVLKETDGPYAHHQTLYQDYADYPQDAQERHYQAGVFFAWEACGLGFRRGGAILDNMSKFVGHVIAD